MPFVENIEGLRPTDLAPRVDMAIQTAAAGLVGTAKAKYIAKLRGDDPAQDAPETHTNAPGRVDTPKTPQSTRLPPKPGSVREKCGFGGHHAQENSH